MSETKKFEELFLSECKAENSSIQELDILLVSDIHKSYDYLEKLKEWTLENKKLFNYIFCTGDMLTLKYPELEDNEIIAKSEAELSAIISFLENICLNVIYIGGNHDPKSLFKTQDVPTLTIKSTNIHKKMIKVSNDLYIVGLGGSTPAIESFNQTDSHLFIPYVDVTDKIKWEGYPYNDVMGNASYKKSDKMYIEDFNEFWCKTKLEIEETNSTNNIKFILLTHIGPFYSNTTLVGSSGKCIYTGSQNLQEFLKTNKDIFLNIHGHSHDAVGLSSFENIKIINPGTLSNGDFAIIKLKRNFDGEWVVSRTEFLNLC
jgi:Icc-related predicted phosphoesterase